MNNARRKNIQDAIDLMTQAQQMLTTAHEEEDDYYNNMPESLQSGEKGDKAQTAVDALSQAADDAQTAIDQAEEALNA